MQTCGLLVVLFLFILYKSHKTLHMPSENTFLMFLAIVFCSLLLDALSIVAIRYRDVIPEWLLELSCKSYIISLIWVGWINFGYVSIDLNSTRERHFRAELILALVTVAESIVAAFLPISIFEDGMTVYSYGPAVYAVYAFTLFYIICTLNVSIYIRKKGSVRRSFAVIVTTSLWIFAAVVQFLNNALLVVGFSEAVGAMILYIVLENPDANLDKRLSCFNSYAFHEYIAMRAGSEKNYSLLDISVADVRSLEDRGFNVDDAVKKVIARLSEQKKILLFKNDLANLIVISDDPERISRATAEVVDMIAEYRVTGENVVLFTLNNAKQFGTPAELLKFLSYTRGNSAARLSTVLHVSDEMIRNYRNIAVIEKEIDAALAEDRVEVFLQPIYSNEEEKVVSAEALARIRKPDGGLLSPAAFIPVAESTGQVKAIGERVLKKVCYFLKNTDAVDLGLRCVDVNLSAVQCDDSTMAGSICRIVEQYGVDPGLIHFEITETAVSNAKDTLLENMNALVSKGFSFALDDFGKGESNLIYIVEMPVKFIKLDIDMSKAYFANPKAKHVVASISEMSHRLGLKIVAEGIETQAEAEGIRAEGIQFIQGYYYSRPLPMKEFLEYLRQNKHREASDVGNGTKTPESEAAIDLSALKGQKVLLVEDNELNRELAKELLEEVGLAVDTAEDGVVAVEKVKNASVGDYDFVLMDIKMPFMDGFEATRRIRELGSENSDLPIIALTAYADEENKKIAASVGIDAMASKPIDVREIMKTAATIESERENVTRIPTDP